MVEASNRSGVFPVEIYEEVLYIDVSPVSVKVVGSTPVPLWSMGLLYSGFSSKSIAGFCCFADGHSLPLLGFCLGLLRLFSLVKFAVLVWLVWSRDSLERSDFPVSRLGCC